MLTKESFAKDLARHVKSFFDKYEGRFELTGDIEFWMLDWADPDSCEEPFTVTKNFGYSYREDA